MNTVKRACKAVGRFIWEGLVIQGQLYTGQVPDALSSGETCEPGKRDQYSA